MKKKKLVKEKEILARNNKKLEDQLQEYQNMHSSSEKVIIDSSAFHRIMKLGESIAGARDEILGLEDDWNGEGAPRFLESTWNKVVTVVRIIHEHMLELKFNIEPPDIEPSDKGAIEIVWSTEDFRFVLHVPMEDIKPLSYYADNYKSTTTRGTIEMENISKVFDACLKMFQKT